MSVFRKDIAPGEPHVALRRKGMCYYVPSLFYLAPTYSKIVPLLIRDVLRSTNPLEIYGSQGLSLNHESYILVKNHPIKKMKVCGRLMSLTSYNFAGFPGRPDKEFYVLSLDDSSGANSSLHVMVQHGIIPVAQLEKDVLVEIIGTMSQITNGTKQLHASSVRILGKSSDVAVELAWWAEALATRKFLSIPWVYIPPNTTRVESSAPRPVFQQRDAQKRRQKQGILTPLPDHLHHNVASTSAFGCVTDSFSLYPR